jgi:hypothetical protein
MPIARKYCFVLPPRNYYCTLWGFWSGLFWGIIHGIVFFVPFVSSLAYLRKRGKNQVITFQTSPTFRWNANLSNCSTIFATYSGAKWEGLYICKWTQLFRVDFQGIFFWVFTSMATFTTLASARRHLQLLRCIPNCAA